MKRFLPAFAAAIILLNLQTCLHAQDPDRPDNSSSADRSLDQNTYTSPTGGQQAVQFLRYTFSPMSFVGAAASAGYGQWRDHPREWKEGSEAFGFRFASAYGAHIVRGTLLYGAAAALHEDVRYDPLRAGSSATRLGHALTGAFAARHPDGTRHVSIARITAFVGAALISRTWQPRSTDGWKNAAACFGTSTGMAIGLDAAREFWPHKQ